MYKVSLKAARVNANLEQRQVAEKLGVTTQTILAWEKGRSIPTVDKLKQLCELYECPFDMIKFQEVLNVYPYHNRIKQRIANGELIGYHFENNYPRIGQCLILEFKTAPFTRPIRPHKYAEYAKFFMEVSHEQ